MAKPRRRLAVLAVIGALAASALTAVSAGAAQAAPPADAGVGVLAAPAFQLPFPCGQTWNGDNDNSSAHRRWEIDFNRGSAYSDLGDTVLAAAGGEVVIASHQGSLNGYGNLVKIDHGGGWASYYAHLNTIAVKVGETVNRGQAIGSVGNTSRPGNNITPHLHYEVRYGSGYPDNIQKAVFNGRTFDYPNADVTSNNCASPYDPVGVCGSDFTMIDSRRLGTKGTVNLLWNGDTQSNCVVTLKFAAVGTPSPTTAYLEPEGRSRTTDSGYFSYYAGPVIRTAPTCIHWGGSTGGVSYNSPSEHC